MKDDFDQISAEDKAERVTLQQSLVSSHNVQ